MRLITATTATRTSHPANTTDCTDALNLRGQNRPRIVRLARRTAIAGVPPLHPRLHVLKSCRRRSGYARLDDAEPAIEITAVARTDRGLRRTPARGGGSSTGLSAGGAGPKRTRPSGLTGSLTGNVGQTSLDVAGRLEPSRKVRAGQTGFPPSSVDASGPPGLARHAGGQELETFDGASDGVSRGLAWTPAAWPGR
jgi:hypothetical protein